MWDPALQEAGLVGARWTQVGAVGWGCGGERGLNPEDTLNTHCKGLRWGAEALGTTSLSHTIPSYWGSLCTDGKAWRGKCVEIAALGHVQPKTLPEPSPGPQRVALGLSVRHLPALFPTGPRDMILPGLGSGPLPEVSVGALH